MKAMRLLVPILWCASIITIHQGFASTCADVTDDSVTIPLENYNGWNLPFAHNANIKTADPEKVFPIGQYLLEVDPTAMFSVVFIETGLEDTGDENVMTLNYTFFGSKELVRINGVWRNLTVNITGNDTSTYSVDINVFVSVNTPPE